MAASGVTVLVTTHYLDEAERCRRVAVIHGGRLAAIGTPAEVKQVFAGRPIMEIRTPRPVETMRVLDGMAEVEKTSLFGTAVHAVLTSDALGMAVLQQRLAAAGLEIEGVERVSPSLEDVFLDLVDRAEKESGSAA
jgi:ABC-2 type transport system ATP-binding protein